MLLSHSILGQYVPLSTPCALCFACAVTQLPKHRFLPLTKLPQARHLSQWKCEIYFQVTCGGDHKVVGSHRDAWLRKLRHRAERGEMIPTTLEFKQFPRGSTFSSVLLLI